MRIISIVFLATKLLILISCSSKKRENHPATGESINKKEDKPGPPQGQKPSFAQLLEKMDTDKDGKLTEGEVEGPLKDDFARVDLNKDGFLVDFEINNDSPSPPPH